MRRSRPPFAETTGHLEVDGGRIFYRALGGPRRPTVLVLHGGPSDHRYLAMLADLVPRGYRVVWYDQLGCGRSSRPRSYREYTMETFGRQAESVRRALGLGRPHLFGHSWGGALALEAATLYPRSFRSLSVCGGFGSATSFGNALRRHTHRLPRALREPIERYEREGNYVSPEYRAAIAERRRVYSTGVRVLPYEFAATASGVNPRLLRAVYGPNRGLLSPPGGLLRGWDLRPRLARIRLPTLIMSGEIGAGRYTARDLHRWLPNSERVTFPGAAHLPFYQSRDRFLETMLRFLDAIPSPGPTRTIRRSAPAGATTRPDGPRPTTACASSGPACDGASASCATSSACGRASSKPAKNVSSSPRPNGRG
ncbi:MAG: proline iminopeptidase-family hydrolase [Thermoplasmata archaeon]